MVPARRPFRPPAPLVVHGQLREGRETVAAALGVVVELRRAGAVLLRVDGHADEHGAFALELPRPAADGPQAELRLVAWVEEPGYQRAAPAAVTLRVEEVGGGPYRRQLEESVWAGVRSAETGVELDVDDLGFDPAAFERTVALPPGEYVAFFECGQTPMTCGNGSTTPRLEHLPLEQRFAVRPGEARAIVLRPPPSAGTCACTCACPTTSATRVCSPSASTTPTRTGCGATTS